MNLTEDQFKLLKAIDERNGGPETIEKYISAQIFCDNIFELADLNLVTDRLPDGRINNYYLTSSGRVWLRIWQAKHELDQRTYSDIIDTG